MKNNIIIIILFYSFSLKAQLNSSIETSIGYEFNINKTPNSYFNNNNFLNKNDLQSSSYYQEGILKLSYTQKWKHNILRAYLTPELRYFFSEPNSNIFILNSRLKHVYFISKKTKLESNIRYRIKDRDGDDFEDIELRTPLGYKLLTLTSGIHLKLHNNNKTLIQFNYDNKKFDNSYTRNVAYNKYGVKINYKNTINTNNTNHSYGTSLSFNSRDYNIKYIDDNRNRYRNWLYLNFSGFYEIPINSNWILKPAFYYENRIDNTDNTFGYHQIKPSFSVKYQHKKISGNIRTDYYVRKFNSLEALNSDNEITNNLTYNYFKVKSSIQYAINKKLTFTTNYYYIDRKSNNTNINTQAYRSYTNYYVSSGLLYNF